MQKQKKATAKSKAKPSTWSGSDLLHIRMIHSETSLRILDGLQPRQLNLNFESTAHQQPQKRDTVIVIFKCSARGVPKEKPDATDSSLMIINATFELAFRVPTPIPEEDVAELSRVGTLVVWPYVRQFISEATINMGQPPFVLPLFKLEATGEGVMIGGASAKKE
jgi:preprotein translocase subunit SecB